MMGKDTFIKLSSLILLTQLPNYFLSISYLSSLALLASSEVLRSDDNLFSNSRNEIPRLPPWNGIPYDNSGQRQMDFTQLFELMGEPRGSRGRELSELIIRPKPKCNRRIRVLNGVTRIRERGSLARFQCSHGYTLIGPTTIVCLRDRWSESPPICVRSGCRPLRTPANGDVRQSIGGAVAAFSCRGNAKLIGNNIMFCDGVRWNGTEPACFVEPETTTLSSFTTTERIIDMDGIPSETEIPDIRAEKMTTVNEFMWDLNVPTMSTPVVIDEAVPTTVSYKKIITTVETNKPAASEVNTSSRPEVASIATVPHSREEMESTSEPSMNRGSIQPLYITSFTHGTNNAFTPAPTTIITRSNEDTKMQLTTTTKPNETETSDTWALTVTTNPPPPTFPTITMRPPVIYKQTTRRSSRLRPNFKIKTKKPDRPKFTRRPKIPRGGRIPWSSFTRKPAKTIISNNNNTTVRSLAPTSSSILVQSNSSPINVDKETFEQVEPIRPILPDELITNVDGNAKDEPSAPQQATFIGGILLFIICITTFSAGVVLYCWRKNKGIARARPYDLDGRTLSAHDDANDDFMYIEQRDSGL